MARKMQAKIRKKTKGSFWKTHDQESYRGGAYLTKGQTKRLIKSGTVVRLNEVGPEEKSKFEKDGKRRVVKLELKDGEEKLKSFTVGNPGMSGRDLFLEEVKEHLEDGGEPVPIRLVKWGDAIGIESPDASDEEEEEEEDEDESDEDEDLDEDE